MGRDRGSDGPRRVETERVEPGRGLETQPVVTEVREEDRKVRQNQSVDAVTRRDSARWGPMWAGLITAITTFLLLQLLALGIGLLLSVAFKTLSGANYRRSRGVYAARAKELKVEAVPPAALEFNADGELIGHGPAEFVVIPRALRVVVGPGYAPEPDRPPGDTGRMGRRAGEEDHGAEEAALLPPLREEHVSEGGP